MTIMTVKIIKAQQWIEVDIDALNDNAAKEVWYRGLMALLNVDMSTKKDEAAMIQARENLEKLKAGNFRSIQPYAKRLYKKSVTGEVLLEAMSIARRRIKAGIKDTGEKLSSFSAKEITKVAKELIQTNPEILDQAARNVKERRT